MDQPGPQECSINSIPPGPWNGYAQETEPVFLVNVVNENRLRPDDRPLLRYTYREFPLDSASWRYYTLDRPLKPLSSSARNQATEEWVDAARKLEDHSNQILSDHVRRTPEGQQAIAKAHGQANELLEIASRRHSLRIETTMNKREDVEKDVLRVREVLTKLRLSNARPPNFSANEEKISAVQSDMEAITSEIGSLFMKSLDIRSDSQSIRSDSTAWLLEKVALLSKIISCHSKVKDILTRMRNIQIRAIRLRFLLDPDRRLD